MIVDIYTHIFPERFFQEMSAVRRSSENIGKRLRNVAKLFDLDERFREMDEFGDYRQIISLPNPPIEDIAKGATGEQARPRRQRCHGGIVRQAPDRFPGFVAAV